MLLKDILNVGQKILAGGTGLAAGWVVHELDIANDQPLSDVTAVCVGLTTTAAVDGLITSVRTNSAKLVNAGRRVVNTRIIRAAAREGGEE